MSLGQFQEMSLNIEYSSWSCDLDHVYKISLPLPKDAPHSVRLWMVQWFQSYLNVVNNDDETTADVRIAQLQRNPNVSLSMP